LSCHQDANFLPDGDLFNPEHPDFEKIKIIKIQPFVFDSRIKTA